MSYRSLTINNLKTRDRLVLVLLSFCAVMLFSVFFLSDRAYGLSKNIPDTSDGAFFTNGSTRIRNMLTAHGDLEAPRSYAYVYIPTSQTSANINIYGADTCGYGSITGTHNYYDGGYAYDVTYTLGSGSPGAVTYVSQIDCTNPDTSLSFTIPTSHAIRETAIGSFYEVIFSAQMAAGSQFSENAFRMEVTNTGAWAGYAGDLYGNSFSQPFAMSNIYGTGNDIFIDVGIEFGVPCGGDVNDEIWSWDDDYGRPFQTTAITWELRSRPRSSSGGQAYSTFESSGNLTGGPDADVPINVSLSKTKDYFIIFRNIKRQNGIQFRLPFPQIEAYTPECSPPPPGVATCSITGPITISPGAIFSLPVRVTNPSTGTIAAGGSNAGLHFGVTTTATTNWNNSNDPLDPPPDKQSTFLPSNSGISGVTYYDFTHTDGFNYKRYYLTSALGSGNNRDVTLRATAPASVGTSTIVVRLLDRVNGDWTPNYCSVTVTVGYPPDCTLTANHTVITGSPTVRLTWTTVDDGDNDPPTSASINQGIGTVTPAAGGYVDVTPTATTTYTMTSTNGSGSDTCPVTVTYLAAPSGVIDVSCDETEGTVNGVISISANLTGASGYTLSATITRWDATSQTRTRTGSGPVSYDNVTVARRPGAYAVSGTVTYSGVHGASNQAMDGDSDTCDLPARPTVTVHVAECNVYTFTVTDVSGEGFTYTAQLQEDEDLDGAGGWVNDGNTTAAPHGVGTVSISGTGSSNFGTRVGNHRDFTTHRFRVLVTNNIFTSTYNAETLREGPSRDIGSPSCLAMRCDSAETLGYPIEVGRPYGIRLRFSSIVRGAAPGATGTRIQPLGRPVSPANNTLTAYARIGGGPQNQVGAQQDLVPRFRNNVDTTFESAIDAYTATSDQADLDVTYWLDSDNDNIDTGSCLEEDAVVISTLPYFQSFRGDVISGYGIREPGGASCANTAGTVRSTVMTTLDGTGYVGSGTQMAVFALGAVSGFRSGITQTSPVDINGQPWARIFANSTPGPRSATGPLDSSSFGGSFDSSMCADNWFVDEPEAYTSVSNGDVIDASTVNGIVRYAATGDTEVTARISYGTPLTGSRKIFITGDAIIGNGGASSYAYSGTWGSVYDVPSSVIVATGDIYIDDDVTDFDGILVSGGTIVTCASTASLATLPDPEGEMPDTDIYRVNPATPGVNKCYTNPLTVNGALIADKVQLWRTGGTISRAFIGGAMQAAQAYQSFETGLTGAETFRLPPEFYVAPRFGETSLNGAAGRKQFDSLISLPPTF